MVYDAFLKATPTTIMRDIDEKYCTGKAAGHEETAPRSSSQADSTGRDTEQFTSQMQIVTVLANLTSKSFIK